MTNNISISKGSYTATIHVEELSENRDNKLNVVPLPQPTQKQDAGPKDPKVMDLLKLEVNFVVRGHMNTTNRNNLINITKGAGKKGGSCSVVYDTHPNTPLNMFIQKCMIKEVAEYKNSGYPYEVQVTLVAGKSQAD